MLVTEENKSMLEAMSTESPRVRNTGKAEGKLLGTIVSAIARGRATLPSTSGRYPGRGL